MSSQPDDIFELEFNEEDQTDSGWWYLALVPGFALIGLIIGHVVIAVV